MSTPRRRRAPDPDEIEEPVTDAPDTDTAPAVLDAPASTAVPPPSDPQPYFGVAAARMTCEICHLPIEPGERYVKGAERGPSHPEPCSHQAG